MTDEAKEWISAAEAFDRVSSAFGWDVAEGAICSRAEAGLIQTKTERLTIDGDPADGTSIPREFWREEGKAFLSFNWHTGDFSALANGRRMRVYGVSFSVRGIRALEATSPREGIRSRLVTNDELISGKCRPHGSRIPSDHHASKSGGRPPAGWWDDMWIEICRSLYEGDLKPKRQSDIQSAMLTWAMEHGYSPADSTIKERARKLWTALSANKAEK